MKNLIYALGILLFISCSSKKSYDYETSVEVDQHSIDSAQVADSISEIKNRIEAATCDIITYETNMDILINQQTTTDDIKADRILLSDIQSFYRKSLTDLFISDTLREQLAKYKLKLIKTQKTVYPKLRKAFAEDAKDRLWEQNIDVQFYGKQLTLVGGIYASNKNIQESYQALSEALYELRFKKISFKWYEYDNGYYYTVESPIDSYISAE